MPKKGAYVVFEAHPGHRTGVYESWPQARLATEGLCEGPQKFKSIEEATRVWEGGDPFHPKHFYAVRSGARAGIYTVYHRAKVAGGGPNSVDTFASREEAEGFLSEHGEAVVDYDTPPPSLCGMAMSTTRTIIFDVETTGLNSAEDQIVSLAYAMYVHGELFGGIAIKRFRPTIAPMSPEAEQVHGISMEMLSDEPTFEEYAAFLRVIFGDAACLMGYNVRFDIAMLQAEFQRSNIEPLDLSDVAIIDPYTLWTNQEPRRLVDAHQRFLNSPMTRAHDAGADVTATMHVFNAMIRHYDMTDTSARELNTITRHGGIDVEGRFLWKK